MTIGHHLHNWHMTARGVVLAVLWLGVGPAEPQANGGASYQSALRRSQYLLSGTVPTDAQYQANASSEAGYKQAVRAMLDNQSFYDAALRYHERLFGTGLEDTYLKELEQNDIDNKTNKIAAITCSRATSGDGRFRCSWSTADAQGSAGSCPASWEQPAGVFWYPGLVAWVCPTVMAACGSDLSRCFIQHQNAAEAKNAELGSTEIFDTRYAVIKSLSRQAAGLAAAVVSENYPYTKILEPGLTAVDGAVVHFLRQDHHFDVTKVSPPANLTSLIDQVPMTNIRYQLIHTGPAGEQGGVLSSFGWLRRYEKDRTRANQLYSRLLCRQFISQLPRVFPQDPGNLRTTPGCMGCHATLDPLADFFKEWGEGGELYTGRKPTVATSFNNQPGSSVSDLANIIRGDNAFATCTVQHVWEWLMGRGFYRDEADLRAALTSYFVTVNYSFKELVYAIATHPGYLEGMRSDATVGDPLAEPPLGQPPGGNSSQPCAKTIDFTADIQPKLSQCTTCHAAGASARQDLTTQAQWKSWGPQAVSMMASGNMPPGQAGPPLIGAVFDLKEAVRCWLEQNK